jgi:hypothetical protein
MFEHVGPKNHAAYLDTAHRLLTEDGLFLLHTIGTDRPTGRTDPWIERYIFPGGHLPAASELARAAEHRFVIEDWHNFGADYDRTLMAYGWYSFDLEELENQEAKYGRAGIMIHGGGSACGWPGAWAPMQPLFATHGCVRMHNKHLRENLFPLTKTGKVYVSVYQEG